MHDPAKYMDKSATPFYNSSMISAFEVVFQEELLNIFDHITRAFGFRVSVLDPSFREVAPLRLQPVCGYCRIVQEELNLLPACWENDRRQCLRAREENRIHYYTCHAGLAEAIYPLFVEKECIGFILVGQFRMDRGIPADLLRKAGPETAAELRRAYEELPAYDTEKLTSVLELLKITTKYIMEHRIVSVKQNLLADKLMAYIKERNHETPRVEEAAGAVHRSVSTVNQTLKAVTGKSFKQLSLSLKMEKAAELLLAYPHLAVAEVSRKVGIEDPFYFSRLFRKIHGLSPREYRRRSPSDA